jgi:hypothetical protein
VGFHFAVEDAFSVCKEIGIEYLWVDRYCIPQDPNVARHQVANMDSVYAGSALTIIAAAGDDPHYGLPGVREKLRPPQPHVKVGSYTLVSTLTNINY